MAMPMIVENAWVTEKILPSWVGGTHFDKIDVDGVDLLPLEIEFNLNIRFSHYLKADMATAKYMCQPLVAKANTRYSSIPLIRPMMARMQS